MLPRVSASVAPTELTCIENPPVPDAVPAFVEAFHSEKAGITTELTCADDSPVPDTALAADEVFYSVNVGVTASADPQSVQSTGSPTESDSTCASALCSRLGPKVYHRLN
jgi:hypothetical protein